MCSDTQINEDEINAKLQIKLFWAMVITGCVANMVGFLSNLALFGLSIPTVVCGACEIMIIVCGGIGIRLQKTKSAATVMVLVLALVEFPFLFYAYGATMGVYLVLGIIGLAVYFPRPYHVPAIIITIVLDIVVVALSYFHSGAIKEMSIENQAGTMLCSYIIVAAAVAVIICNLINQYALQQQHIVSVSQELEYAAHRDALTGVYNRRYLINTLNEWMNKENHHFMAVLIDIDDFKKINDTYGHLYGDEILVELARLMEEGIEGKGIVARYGGEEFMFLFEKPDRQMAFETLERIKDGIGEYSRKTKQITVTFSGGVAEYWTDARIDELFRNADRKLYQAKSNGKNQVIF